MMVYLPGIFTYKTGWCLRQMLATIPYMEHMGTINGTIIQWIGLREILQEGLIFNGKIYGFL